MQRWAVVCEGARDCEQATTLADREIELRIGWAAGILDSLREWTAVEESERRTDEITGRSFTPRKKISQLAKTHRIRYLGQRGESPGSAYAEVWKAVRLLSATGITAAAAILVALDSDGDEGRVSLQRAAEELDDPTGVRVCVAALHPEREAWVLSGFELADDGERATHAAIRREIGFCPLEGAHRLNPKRTHTPGGQPIAKSTKLILARLSGEDPERERRCWRETTLERLRERGEQTGLRRFLDDVHQRLAPQLGS